MPHSFRRTNTLKVKEGNINIVTQFNYSTDTSIRPEVVVRHLQELEVEQVQQLLIVTTHRRYKLNLDGGAAAASGSGAG